MFCVLKYYMMIHFIDKVWHFANFLTSQLLEDTTVIASEGTPVRRSPSHSSRFLEIPIIIDYLTNYMKFPVLKLVMEVL